MHLLLKMLTFSSGEHISRLVGRKGRTVKRRGYQRVMVAKQPFSKRNLDFPQLFHLSPVPNFYSCEPSSNHFSEPPCDCLWILSFYKYLLNMFSEPCLRRDCMVQFSLLTPTAFNNVLHVADTKLVFVVLNRWVLWVHQRYIMDHTSHSTDIFI